MVLRCVEILTGFIIQLSVLSATPTWWDLGGATLVMMAVIIMGLEDIVMARISYSWF